MIIDLNIDDIINEFNLPINLSDVIVKDTVLKVTNEIYRNWTNEATKKLKSTRNEYINNLQIKKITDYHRAIVLEGVLPNMIEQGVSAFDMKIGFKKSSKVKYSVKTDKNGNEIVSWYLTIPFRHGTPGIVGENSAFSLIMPEEIYEIIKYKNENSPIKKSEMPIGFDMPKSRKQIVLPTRTIPEYTHKSSIYEGLVKKTGQYDKIKQNTYLTFRRVGENSDDDSWIHKGIQAHNFMQKALQSSNIDILVENNVDRILSENGYGTNR